MKNMQYIEKAQMIIMTNKSPWKYKVHVAEITTLQIY